MSSSRESIQFCSYIHEVCSELKEKGVVLNAVAICGIIAYNTSYGTTTIYKTANNPMGIMVDPKWEGGVYRSNSSALVDGKWIPLQFNYKRYLNLHHALTDFFNNILPSMDIYPELQPYMEDEYANEWIELFLRTYDPEANHYIEQVQKRATLVAANRS